MNPAYMWLCDIIQTVMGLAPGRVMIWDQKYNTPNDLALFIVVRCLVAKTFGTTRQYLPDTNAGAVESISVNRCDTMSIDIMSRGPDARDRNWEVIAALCSTYAENSMATNGFYISKIPTATAALDQEDGAAIPYRFNVTVNLQYTLTKTNGVSYYDHADAMSVVLNP